MMTWRRGAWDKEMLSLRNGFYGEAVASDGKTGVAEMTVSIRDRSLDHLRRCYVLAVITDGKGDLA
jgi:hypothetical protein